MSRITVAALSVARRAGLSRSIRLARTRHAPDANVNKAFVTERSAVGSESSNHTSLVVDPSSGIAHDTNSEMPTPST